jgi:hypothetical protein
MKKAILHIGCEKTGTTSIQNFLYENRNEMLDRHGILYPESLGKRNHTKLAIFSCEPDKNLIRFLPNNRSIDYFRRKTREDFINEVFGSPAETVIISNEWLHPRLKDPVEFDRLKSLLNEVVGETEIIFYVRRQDELAISLYSTSLRAGNYRAFRFPEIRSRQALPYFYDFYEIYKNWSNHFGKDHVSVRIFDRKRLTGNDVVRDFLSYLELGESNLSIPYEENLSLNAFGISMMRLVNYLCHKFDIDPQYRTIKTFRNRISEYFSGKSKLATESERREFLENFSRSNALLFSELSLRFGRKIPGFDD